MLVATKWRLSFGSLFKKNFFFFCSVFKRHSVATILGHVLRVDSRQSGTFKRSYLPCWSLRPQESEGCSLHVAALQPAYLFLFTPLWSLPEPAQLKSTDRTDGCGSKASRASLVPLSTTKAWFPFLQASLSLSWYGRLVFKRGMFLHMKVKPNTAEFISNAWFWNRDKRLPGVFKKFVCLIYKALDIFDNNSHSVQSRLWFYRVSFKSL